MDEKQVFYRLLGLTPPWYVTRVEMNSQDSRVDVWIEHEKNILFACPECGIHSPVYDHAPERVLRHLNVFEHQTFLHVRIPRIKCKTHGVRATISDFGKNNSAMTFAFESYLINLDQECSIEVAMDMWAPYIAATRAYIPGAQQKIVFDRFHVMRYVIDAVDSVRKQEHKSIQRQGNQSLKGAKYLWLWNRENVPEYCIEEVEQLHKKDFKVSRAYTLKEDLRHMWDYRYPKCMRRYFDKWYRRARRSRLEPMKNAAATLRNHIDNIVTYAKHRITDALAESINAKIEKAKRMACGFRNRHHYKTAICFHCRGLDLYPRLAGHCSYRWAAARRDHNM